MLHKYGVLLASIESVGRVPVKTQDGEEVQAYCRLVPLSQGACVCVYQFAHGWEIVCAECL